MPLRRRRFLQLATAAATLRAVSRKAWSQSYPTRPITLIVSVPPGGGADAIGRIVVERMRASLGQPIVIEIVAGASGSIATGRAAHATPDGYMLLVGVWNTQVANANSSVTLTRPTPSMHTVK
jgi:tripartite-type tricarboxylate transporter receptor subunit TctC